MQLSGENCIWLSDEFWSLSHANAMGTKAVKMYEGTASFDWPQSVVIWRYAIKGTNRYFFVDAIAGEDVIFEDYTESKIKKTQTS